MISWITRKSIANRIDKARKAQYETERKYWQNIFKRIISSFKFLSLRGLAFKRDVQEFGCSNNDNYLGCLEFLSQYDQILADRIIKYGRKCQGNPSYLTWIICDEFIELLAQKVKTRIISETKSRQLYAISVDSTADLSRVDQLTFVIRYVQDNGTVCERFVQFLKVSSHTSEQLANTVKSILDDLTLDIADCRGPSIDNASNMFGQYNGLLQRLIDTNGGINFVPCAAHSLNLVGVRDAECCLEAIHFSGFL